MTDVSVDAAVDTSVDVSVDDVVSAGAARPPDLADRPHGTSVEHHVDAPADVVFRFWTDRFDEWFAEPGTVTMRTEPGEPYFFETFHMGRRHPHYGRVLAFEPGHLLEITWLNEAGTHGVETVLRVEIDADESDSGRADDDPPDHGHDRARVLITHAGFRDEQTAAEHGTAWRTLLAGRLDAAIARTRTSSP